MDTKKNIKPESQKKKLNNSKHIMEHVMCKQQYMVEQSMNTYIVEHITGKCPT